MAKEEKKFQASPIVPQLSVLIVFNIVAQVASLPHILLQYLCTYSSDTNSYSTDHSAIA